MLNLLNNKYLLLLVLVVILAVLLLLTYSFMTRGASSQLPMKKLKIGDKVLSVEIAEKQADQIQGLSGREKLDQNSGLYFKYDSVEQRAIWMKDMKFAIDVLWIRSGVVGSIDENIVPKGMGMPIVNAKEKSDAFLEVNAGFVKANNLKVGDPVTFLD